MNDKPIIHYWNGYGNLCMTEDGRRNDAECSSVVSEVTCVKCWLNLQTLGKVPESSRGTGGSDE